MNPDEIEIKVIADADRDSVKKLYLQAGWWQESDQTPDGNSWIDALVRGSFCFVGAFAGAEMIGMGRAVSDGVSDAYIQDVVVLKKFRGQGIGAAIVRKLSDFLKVRHIGWIGLVAEPGTEPFYRRLGFEVMEGYAPMLLKKQGV
jgi:aralkylamine N-acetyltransferase